MEGPPAPEQVLLEKGYITQERCEEVARAKKSYPQWYTGWFQPTRDTLSLLESAVKSPQIDSLKTYTQRINRYFFYEEKTAHAGNQWDDQYWLGAQTRMALDIFEASLDPNDRESILTKEMALRHVVIAFNDESAGAFREEMYGRWTKAIEETAKTHSGYAARGAISSLRSSILQYEGDSVAHYIAGRHLFQSGSLSENFYTRAQHLEEHLVEKGLGICFAPPTGLTSSPGIPMPDFELPPHNSAVA